MNTTINWLNAAFANLVAFLPNLVAGIVILLVGWLIAALLARATRVVARRLGFDRLVAKLGFSSTALRGEKDASYRLGSVVYAIVMVVAILQASRAWNLYFVANGLAAVIGYLPHVLAAVVVFGFALIVGNWVRARLARTRAVEAETGIGAEVVAAGPRILPELVRGTIIGIGAFMALRELQIAPEIVNAAFMLTLGALAVATALAFGLGGREVAGRMAQSWWDRRGGGGIGPVAGPTGPTGRFDVTPV